MLSPELAPVHPRIKRLERFNHNTRLLLFDQACSRANPLGMLWPELDAAFVTSGGGNGRPPTTAQRQMVLIAAG